MTRIPSGNLQAIITHNANVKRGIEDYRNGVWTDLKSGRDQIEYEFGRHLAAQGNESPSGIMTDVDSYAMEFWNVGF